LDGEKLKDWIIFETTAFGLNECFKQEDEGEGRIVSFGEWLYSL
jgi:hypothetical protein